MAAAMPIVRVDEEVGLVRYCFGCDEWWPSDDEACWRPENWSRRALCVACVAERRRPSMQAASRRYRESRRV